MDVVKERSQLRIIEEIILIFATKNTFELMIESGRAKPFGESHGEDKKLVRLYICSKYKDILQPPRCEV